MSIFCDSCRGTYFRLNSQSSPILMSICEEYRAHVRSDVSKDSKSAVCPKTWFVGTETYFFESFRESSFSPTCALTLRTLTSTLTKRNGILIEASCALQNSFCSPSLRGFRVNAFAACSRPNAHLVLRPHLSTKMWMFLEVTYDSKIAARHEKTSPHRMLLHTLLFSAPPKTPRFCLSSQRCFR